MFVENLENRRLFAVGLVGTQLQITGSAAADVIRVSQQDANTIRVEENGAVSLWADASVGSILMNGNTIVIGGVAANPSNGTAGNDTLQVISPAGVLALTEPVTMNGGLGNDTMTGGHGNDTMRGQDNNDVMSGGAGSDNMDGGNGVNTLSGGDGNDTMTAGTAADNFDGGTGTDTVSYSTRTAAVNVSLDNVANDGQTTIITLPPPSLPIVLFENDNVRDTVENVTGGSGNDVITASAAVVNNVFTGNGGNDRLDGRAGNDNLSGGSGDDVLLGGAGADFLSGSTGNDTLVGGADNDNLFGGDGNDVLSGGLGADSMRGEAGNDFLFAADSLIDTLIDGGLGFDIAERDATDPLAVGVELLA